MKVFQNLVNISQSLDFEQMSKIVVDRLREGKSDELCDAIDKYAEYFISEFCHFLRLHGFIKQ